MGNGMNKILPGLYVGNIKDSKDQEQLAKNNITHILSIHDNAKPVLEDKKYLCIDASDTPNQNLLPYFQQCIKFIHKARMEGGVVLVHCLAGVSRSVTVTVAYVMTLTNHNLRDVLSAVRRQREVANPNSGFLKQLQEYEDEQLEQKRIWLRKKYEYSMEEDHSLIESLCELYNKKENAIYSSPPEVESGSTSSTFPLNKQEDCVPSSSWENSKRRGVIVDDSNSLE